MGSLQAATPGRPGRPSSAPAPQQKPAGPGRLAHLAPRSAWPLPGAHGSGHLFSGTLIAERSQRSASGSSSNRGMTCIWRCILKAAVDPHGHEQCGGDAGCRASRLGRRVPYVLQAGVVVGRVGWVGQPAVVEPPRAGECRRGRAAEPDRRPGGPAARKGSVAGGRLSNFRISPWKEVAPLHSSRHNATVSSRRAKRRSQGSSDSVYNGRPKRPGKPALTATAAGRPTADRPRPGTGRPGPAGAGRAAAHRCPAWPVRLPERARPAS